MEITIDRSWRHWWVFLIRGILFILLGIYMFASPAGSYAALAFLFGLIILVAGVSELMRVVREKSEVNRGWHLAIGVFDIIVGLSLIGHIAAGEALLRIIVGLWILIKGVSVLIYASRAPRLLILIVGGVIVVLFGLLVLINPVFGSVTIVLWTAFAFVMMGIMNIMLSLRLKKLER
jgi:uncharacterized membrane protein HdeD (DUF308 family)